MVLIVINIIILYTHKFVIIISPTKYPKNTLVLILSDEIFIIILDLHE